MELTYREGIMGIGNASSIADRILASANLGAVNGDPFEREICEQQMREAGYKIHNMEKMIRGAIAALSQHKTFPADIEAAKKFLETALTI